MSCIFNSGVLPTNGVKPSGNDNGYNVFTLNPPLMLSINSILSLILTLRKKKDWYGQYIIMYVPYQIPNGYCFDMRLPDVVPQTHQDI